MKLLLNLLATFVLVLLLATPQIFSANLVDFKIDSGIVISNNAGKFGKFLHLWQDYTRKTPKFNLEFRTFANPALYQGILTVENNEDSEKLVQILNNSYNVVVFFDVGRKTSGPEEVKLLSGQKAEINLLVLPNSQAKTASFSLKLD